MACRAVAVAVSDAVELGVAPIAILVVTTDHADDLAVLPPNRSLLGVSRNGIYSR